MVRRCGAAVCAVALLALFAACGGVPPPAAAPLCSGVRADEDVLEQPALELDADAPSSANARAWVDVLAAPGRRGRRAGGPEARAVAALLARHLSRLGLEAPFDDGYCQSFPLLDDTDHNVIAHLTAGDAATRRAVLVGAHYDGQGLHPAGQLRAQGWEPFVYPSADDNASGVAALVEVARLARRRSWPFDLVVVAFGAEETSQMGARAWVEEPTIDLRRIQLMINFDMVGRPGPPEAPRSIGFLASGADSGDLGARLHAAGARAGVAVRPLAGHVDENTMRSDSDLFRPHVSTLYLTTGLHADHHQRTDTPERLDEEQVARAARLTLALLDELARTAAEERVP